MKKTTHRSLVWLGMWAAASMSSAFANTPPCQGQTVYGNNGNDLVGEVTALYGQKAEVRWIEMNGAPYSGDRSFWDLSSLSIETECSGNICRGRAVYGNNGDDLVGKVVRTFENGKAEVSWASLGGSPYSGTPSYWDASSLSRETRCSGAICEGDQVFGDNGNNLVGTVNRVFKNGKAEVNWTEMNGQPFSGAPNVWDASSLQKRTGPCGDQACRR